MVQGFYSTEDTFNDEVEEDGALGGQPCLMPFSRAMGLLVVLPT